MRQNGHEMRRKSIFSFQKPSQNRKNLTSGIREPNYEFTRLTV